MPTLALVAGARSHQSGSELGAEFPAEPDGLRQRGDVAEAEGPGANGAERGLAIVGMCPLTAVYPVELDREQPAVELEFDRGADLCAA